MTVIFATVGFTPSKVHPVIDAEDEKEELVLFFDKESAQNAGRSKRAADELTEYARKLDVPVKQFPIDAFDLVLACQLMRKEIRKRKDKGTEDIVVGISGGTRVLSSAALLAAILEGVRVLHISEKDNAVQPLPMLRLEAADVMHPKQRRVLKHIREHPGCSQQDIAQALQLTKGTVSHHVQGLKRQGLVQQDAGADARSPKLRAVPSADLLLME